ncbi:MAG: hypothetical protein HRT87_08630 [Legionellales bacterium]|nr:hypothetical protein [Legionellales bacterium]
MLKLLNICMMTFIFYFLSYSAHSLIIPLQGYGDNFGAYSCTIESQQKETIIIKGVKQNATYEIDIQLTGGKVFNKVLKREVYCDAASHKCIISEDKKYEDTLTILFPKIQVKHAPESIRFVLINPADTAVTYNVSVSCDHTAIKDREEAQRDQFIGETVLKSLAILGKEPIAHYDKATGDYTLKSGFANFTSAVHKSIYQYDLGQDDKKEDGMDEID